MTGVARGGGAPCVFAWPPDCWACAGMISIRSNITQNCNHWKSNRDETLSQVKERGVEVKGVTFHRFAFEQEVWIENFCNLSVVERGRAEGRASRPWRNIFPGSRSRSGTQREVRTITTLLIVMVIIILIQVNIDEAVLMPESKPINFRPRPRSEVNLSYSVQVSLIMMVMIMIGLILDN